MDDLKKKLEQAYDAAVSLSGKQYAKVTFEFDNVKFTVHPVRLGRKIKDLTEREAKLVALAKLVAGVEPDGGEYFVYRMDDTGVLFRCKEAAQSTLKSLGINTNGDKNE